MDRKTSTDLMRLLHGEMPDPAGQELRDRLEREPELRGEFESLEQQWLELELPDPPSAPPGFATRTVARARLEADRGFAPAWWSHTLAGRFATALVFAGGIAFGAILATPSEAEDWSGFFDSEPTLAESYLLVMEEQADDSWQESDS